jgi:hypothetical protein
MERPEEDMVKTVLVDRATRGDYWREHVERWGKSGLRQKEYCIKEGISIERFGYWKRRFERKSRSVGERLVAVPPGIISTALSEGRGMLGLVVRDQYRIEIPERFSPATLAAVLEVLNRM